MTDAESENLFKYITKAIRTVGVTISISRLTDRVFLAVDALLIEKMKDLSLNIIFRFYHSRAIKV